MHASGSGVRFEISKTLLLFAAALLFVSAAPYICRAEAVSSLAWGNVVWDDNTGEIISDDRINMVNGGTYAVPLHVSKDVDVARSEPGIFTSVNGVLYRIPDPQSPTRELIETVGGFSGEPTLSWEEPGVYELDVYRVQVFQNDRSPYRIFFHLFFGDTVYAQSADDYIETIRFTITDASLTPQASNVLFLPGLEASRLYKQNVVGAPEKRLWEPEIAHNNADLFLNADGTSKQAGIYTKDVIDEAYTANIYKNFEASMDALVTQNVITAWEPYPYDWRFDVNDIVSNPTALATTTASLIAEVEKLAATSKTGKVTLIGHSNGGLVGKLLINKLQSQGKVGLIDKFIMVAVPQLGTPKAILSLLHGEGFPLDALPILLSPADGRTLGENMPGAYTLLPSPEYFHRVLDPVVTFDLGTLTQKYRNMYGVAVTTPTEFKNFLLGAEGRKKPASTDLYTPNILNSPLLSRGQLDHNVLDSWQAPTGIQVIQIAGWGVPTIEGINYLDRDMGTSKILDHEPILTSDGDGTVVIPSATAGTTTTYYIDLKSYNQLSNLHVSRRHADIMEVDQLPDFINNILQNNNTLTPFIGNTKPASSPGSNSLRLKVHSPVSLELHDSLGRHTGISTSMQLGQDRVIDEQIPNSYYFEIGEGKYAGADMNGITTVELSGQSFGSFTLDIAQVQGDVVVASTTFADVPVTGSTTAAIDILTLEGTSPQILVDIDGDGKTDASISPGVGLSTDELIAVFRGLIKTLHLLPKKEEKLLKEVDKLQKVLEKEYNNNDRQKKYKTKDALKKLSDTVKKFQNKKLLTSDESSELLNVIEKIKTTLKI